ncbi:MAG: DUF2470 domain-containing protein, partial [Pseudomonadota bacterium]
MTESGQRDAMMEPSDGDAAAGPDPKTGAKAEAGADKGAAAKPAQAEARTPAKRPDGPKGRQLARAGGRGGAVGPARRGRG